MFFISFIRNNKASSFLILVWTILIFFGVISYSPPQWLSNISEQGKYSEAFDLNKEANRFLKLEEYSNAIDIYQSVLKRWPDMESAKVNLAIAYSKSGQLSLAASAFEDLLADITKHRSVIYSNLAEVYEKQGKQGLAIKNYLHSCEIAPYPLYAYQKIGELLMNRKKFDKAIIAFDQSIEHKLDMRNAYIGMIKLELEELEINSEEYNNLRNLIEEFDNSDISKRFDNSIFETVLSSNKGLAKTYNNLGYCYAMNNNFEESIYYFQQSLEIWPDFNDAKRNLKAIQSQLMQN